MMEEKTATLEDLKVHYSRVLYRAEDGNFYRLVDYYPFHFNVKDRPDCICLDTGGEMGHCDFGVFKVEEGRLLREVDSDGNFREVSSKLIIRGIT